MMYLSKWSVNHRIGSSYHLRDSNNLRNPYNVHRLLWQAFPQQMERTFLFRMEPDQLLMQSWSAPQAISHRGLNLVAVKPFAPQFKSGQLLRFLVRANPVKRLKHDGHRVPLIVEEEQIAWLQRQVAQSAQLLEVRVEKKEVLYFSKKKEQPGKVVLVTYAGFLKLQEVEAFLETMQKGIGPAKCFGCGMLSLARG